MAYFSNGTEGDMYTERVCSHCVHKDGCVVMLAHLIHNYDQIKDGKMVTDHPLNILIPHKGPAENGLCRMFYSEDKATMEKAKAVFDRQD